MVTCVRTILQLDDLQTANNTTCASKRPCRLEIAVPLCQFHRCFAFHGRLLIKSRYVQLVLAKVLSSFHSPHQHYLSLLHANKCSTQHTAHSSQPSSPTFTPSHLVSDCKKMNALRLSTRLTPRATAFARAARPTTAIPAISTSKFSRTMTHQSLKSQFQFHSIVWWLQRRIDATVLLGRACC